MNIGNSMSLRARINNFAKAKGVSPQLALQSFFAERFLARIEKSPYVENIALKGGTLLSAILGIVNCGGQTLSELYTARDAKGIAKLPAMVP